MAINITREEYKAFAYQKFVTLMREAQSFSEAVDAFDLTDAPTTKERWDNLRAMQFKSAFELIDFCMTSGASIVGGLENAHGLTMMDLEENE